MKDGDNWGSIASANRVDVGALITFNFKTSNPDEINWYLREKVGCRMEAPDHDNYRFSSRDVPGIIYIPKAAAPPAPPCAYDFSQSIEIEAREANRTRQQSIEVANRFSAPSARSGAPAISFRRSPTPSTGSPSSMKS